MKKKNRSVYAWMIASALFLCALGWGIFLLTSAAEEKKLQPEAGVVSSKRPSNARPERDEMPDKGQAALPQFITLDSKNTWSGTLRLKPDEAAILSYSELAPGMYGAVIITPELEPDGRINLKTRFLRMTEEDALRGDNKGMFPDFFEIEHQGVLKRERVDQFLASTANNESAHVREMPPMITNSGEGTSTVLSGSNRDGTPFNDGKGLMLAMTPQALGNEGGVDLKFDMRHLDPQSSSGENQRPSFEVITNQ